MICGLETTAVTEHICSKTRQLFFHELRSVLNSESTTCFTDGHKRSDGALPAVCPFTLLIYILQPTVVIPNFCPFCDTHKGKFLNSLICEVGATVRGCSGSIGSDDTRGYGVGSGDVGKELPRGMIPLICVLMGGPARSIPRNWFIGC